MAATHCAQPLTHMPGDLVSMMTRQRVAAVTALALLAACGGGENTPTAPDAPTLQLREIVITDTSGRMLSFSHRDHWHGFPVVPMGADLAVRTYFSAEQRDADDHDAPSRASWIRMDTLSTDFNLRVVVSDTSVARFAGDRRGGQFTGLRANSASVVSFVVRRGTATVYEAPPLNFTVR
jgi:hypothetical protein